MNKPFIILFFLCIYPLFLDAQTYTSIPDPNFEQALIDLGIDNGSIDGRVLTSSITSVKELYVINRNISDLTGIQGFSGLQTLNCANNKLTGLNISNNLALSSLDCSSNQLALLHISSNTALNYLNCSNNNLTNLDISANTLLNQLSCASNRLTSLNVNNQVSLNLLNCSNNQLIALDISNNSMLNSLFCASNKLDVLDLTANNNLSMLDCSSNQLKTIDVSRQNALVYLTCSSNQLSNINLTNNNLLEFLDLGNNQLKALLISGNTALVNVTVSSNQLKSIQLSNNLAIEKLDISYNMLGNLDISANSSIKSIDCSSNLLKTLNLKNGNNINLASLNASSNPYLRCISVDNPASANANLSWKKDNHAVYQANCIAYTYVLDTNFEAALSAWDDIANDGFVPTATIAGITKLDISNLGIADITGIQDFLSLDTLDCSNNQLFNLDIGNLANLIWLDCSGSNLADLNLSNGANAKLLYMDARDNPTLSCIKVDDTDAALLKANWYKDAAASYNLACLTNKTYIPDPEFETALIELGYDAGALDQYVYTDSITNITRLIINNRNITDLTGIEAFASLDTLDCSINKLSSINLLSNIALKYLNCSGNYLNQLDISNNPLLTSLSCGDNKLPTIEVNANTELKTLNINGNFLTDIDLTNNINLIELNANSNLLSSIDLSSNDKLERLYCSKNKLGSINLSHNDSLQVLDCSNNYLTTLDLQNTHVLQNLDCSLNSLTSLDLQHDTLLVSVKCNSNQISQLDFEKNPLLRLLNCSNNRLTSLLVANNDSIRQMNVSGNALAGIALENKTFLHTLEVGDNLITGLDLASKDSLKILICSNNQLQSLDVTGNPSLVTLKCNTNKLTQLDIGNNNLLTGLEASNNLIESLDLGNALNLKELVVDFNRLLVLDIGANPQLTMVSCTNNLLAALDFSSNPNLVSMNCSSNKLLVLNGRNGNNTTLQTFYSTNNRDLRCIEIDNISAIGASWVKDTGASYSANCHYGETFVPDDNFEAALSVIIGEAFNNNDNYISTAAIQAITNLDISNRNISDLTGLQDFKSLTTLNCTANSITLLELKTHGNLLTLNCSNNLIANLDLSQNSKLEQLNYSNNLIQAINLKPLANLQILTGNNNSLSEIDLRHNTNLTNVNLSVNQLVIMHLNNGNNGILATMDATSNPLLFCMEVDDSGLANAGEGVYATWQTDAGLQYGNNCHYNETYVPDNAFERVLKDMGYDDAGPIDNYVPTAKINQITYLGLANKGISDLTGIEDFTALITLNCTNNNLSSLDISKNTNLTTLICSGNKLSTISILSNTALKKLDISNNLLTSLDISANTGLERLLCASNLLRDLNILTNTALIELNCASNKLLNVDASNGSNHMLQFFDLRKNPDLRCILVDDIQAAAGYSSWYKDPQAAYKLVCDDDDNDGVKNENDLCPDTPFGDIVDLFGCTVFILPSDNFTVLTKSETCRGGNDGKVTISAVQIYNYTATLTGTIDTIVQRFTNVADIRNLRADKYNLCITIDNIPNYSQCYQVVITQPDDLTVKSKMDYPGKRLQLDLSGGDVYTVNFNGLVFQTRQTELDLPLKNGRNTVLVMADAACQGIFKETIFFADIPVAFPNPFGNHLNVFTGENKPQKVWIKLISLSGQVVLSSDYQTEKGLVTLHTSGIKPGIYYILIKTETQESTIKIVKE
jgi:trimeric autotransporter adhesin